MKNSKNYLMTSTPTLTQSHEANAMAQQIHTYAELRQQIHDNLRIQHPEWVEPNGESSMRLMELLDALMRKGPTGSVAARISITLPASS